MPTLVSNGIVNGKQKGPGTDASFITAMKRERAVVNVANSAVYNPTNPIRDGIYTRGFTNGVIPYFFKRGSHLGFFPTQ